MSHDPIKAEREAFESLTKLFSLAEESRRLFERANLGMPETLKRFFAVNGTGHVARVYIPPIDRRSKPREALDNHDWISIPVKEATPTSVVRAILREAKEPITAQRMVEQVTAYLPNVPAGSIYNVGARLAAFGSIHRTKAGWSLSNKENGGLIHDGFIWGPESVFEKTDIAKHRREAILYLLGLNKSGMQIVQVVESLRACTWVHAPINKDLLKEDFEYLRKTGKVRRVGASKKWELAPTDKKEGG